MQWRIEDNTRSGGHVTFYAWEDINGQRYDYAEQMDERAYAGRYSTTSNIWVDVVGLAIAHAERAFSRALERERNLIPRDTFVEPGIQQLRSGDEVTSWSEPIYSRAYMQAEREFQRRQEELREASAMRTAETRLRAGAVERALNALNPSDFPTWTYGRMNDKPEEKTITVVKRRERNLP